MRRSLPSFAMLKPKNLRSFQILSGAHLLHQEFRQSRCGSPVEMGKDLWLAEQGIGIAFYVVGIAFAFGGIRRHHLESDVAIPAMPTDAGR
jgi:hypothetical protein